MRGCSVLLAHTNTSTRQWIWPFSVGPKAPMPPSIHIAERLCAKSCSCTVEQSHYTSTFALAHAAGARYLDWGRLKANKSARFRHKQTHSKVWVQSVRHLEAHAHNWAAITNANHWTTYHGTAEAHAHHGTAKTHTHHWNSEAHAHGRACTCGAKEFRN